MASDHKLPRSFLSADIFAEAKRLELQAKRFVDSDLIGGFRSAFKGSGITFSHLREYQPGDDVRKVDWKVAARTGKLFVRAYEEERQLNIIIALDSSRSTVFGTPKSKHRRALEFATLLTFVAAGSGDQVGLVTFAEEVLHYVPPRNAKDQVHFLTAMLLGEAQLQGRTDLRPTLQLLQRHLRRNSIIFILSDFIAPNFEAELRSLSYRHDVIGVMLEDPLDSAIPPIGLVQYQDLESGKIVTVDTRSKRTLEDLKRLQLERLQSIKEQFYTCSAELLVAPGSPSKELHRLMRRRAGRKGSPLHR